MTQLIISVRDFGQDSSHHDWDDDKPTHLNLKIVEIVAGMSARGRTGIRMLLEGDDGKKYYVNTSARLFVNGVAAAGRGAMERFGDDPNQA
jgi:hypothetical protein